MITHRYKFICELKTDVLVSNPCCNRATVLHFHCLLLALVREKQVKASLLI